MCAELRRLEGHHRHHFCLDRGSFARGGAPWAPHPVTLWVVNHLGGRLVHQPGTSVRDRDSQRYLFDFDRAERDIGRLRMALADAVATGTGAGSDPVRIDAIDIDELAPDAAEASTPSAVDAEIVAVSGYGAARAPSGAVAARHVRRTPAEDEEASDMAESRRVLSPTDDTARRRSVQRSAEVGRRARAAPHPAAGITEPSRCQYAAMPCRGCLDDIGLDAWMIPGGDGMVHNTASCYQAAAQRRDDAAAQFEAGEAARRRQAEGPHGGPTAVQTEAAMGEGPTAPVDFDLLGPSIEHTPFSSDLTAKPARADRNQRVVQLSETMSDARRAMVRTCIEGKCEHLNSDEPKMTCIGSCHRQLHGVKCAQLAHGQACLAVFHCAECRLGQIMDDGPPYTEMALRNAEETMLQEMSSGAEKTGAGFADFVKLEAEWALSMNPNGGVKLPSDHSASLKLFLTWLVREKERARSLGSLWRVIGLYMIKSGRVNLTYTDSSVKAHYSSLLETHGVEEHPRTSATPRMIDIMVNKGVVDKHCPKPYIRARTKLNIGLEVGCGVRVGEAMGSGDYHGVKAGHAAMLRHIDSGLVTVELMLEHSKTKFKRWSNCLGTTLGTAQLPLAQLMRDYWQASGMKVVSWVEGGYEVTTVDYIVARVTMLGMSDRVLGQVEAVLKGSKVAAVRKAATATMARARQRKDAKNSKDKRYINVHGGEAESLALGQVALEFEQAGLSAFLSFVEGPLLRSTDAHDGGTVCHMPLDPSTTYSTLHAVMDEAYELANPEGDADPWLDLQGLETPLWAHHSLRRCADTVARSTMARSGVSEQDIDRVFGWREAEYSHRMQYHYETRFNRDRRYRVTMYL